MTRINPYFERDRKKIMRLLKKIHKERKRDFIFKAKYLAKLSGINSHMIGNLLEKIPFVEKKAKTAGVYVYKTCFKQGGIN
jgi:hypothetical protein